MIRPSEIKSFSRWFIDEQLNETPEIAVHRTGRWTYHMVLTHGCLLVNSWVHLSTRKRAQRLRARHLAKYERYLERERRWREELETWKT